MRRSLLVLLTTVLLVLLPGIARAACEDDTQCKGDRICVEGECVYADECEKDTDCPGEAVCEAARCVERPGLPPVSSTASGTSGRLPRPAATPQDWTRRRSWNSVTWAGAGLSGGIGAVTTVFIALDQREQDTGNWNNPYYDWALRGELLHFGTHFGVAGLGVGTAISTQLLAKRGGKIGFRSAFAAGTVLAASYPATFFVYLAAGGGSMPALYVVQTVLSVGSLSLIAGDTRALIRRDGLVARATGLELFWAAIPSPAGPRWMLSGRF